MVSTLEQMQVPNGTGPGVRRSKRPLLASRTRCNVLWKPPKFWKVGILKTGLTTPTDRPKSVHNRCVIDGFGGVFVLSLSFLIFLMV